MFDNVLADIGYVVGIIAAIGGVAYFFGTQFRAGKRDKTKSANQQLSADALATIATLEANVKAIKEQRDIIKETSDKATERLEKQIDDLTSRNSKLEDQVKNLSVIPWAKQEENHTAVMNSLATIADGQTKLLEFLSTQSPITPVATKTVTTVETK